MKKYLHDYYLVGNFNGKILWQIAKIMTVGEIYLVVEQVLAIMIFITKILWPDTWSYQSDAETGNRLPKSSLVSDWQWYQCLRSYMLFGLPSSSFYLGVHNFSETWCPCTAAVDGELHADDLIDASSCWPIVHVEAMIMQKWWHQTESLGRWNIGGFL